MSGLSPVGCSPKQRYPSATNECNEQLNSLSRKYNDELKKILGELQSELKNFLYSYLDSYRLSTEFLQNPALYGFNETKAACCGLGKLRAQLACTPLALYCSDRNSHIFWDLYHPTEAASRISVAKLCDPSQHYASPITVNQLISM